MQELLKSLEYETNGLNQDHQQQMSAILKNILEILRSGSNKPDNLIKQLNSFKIYSNKKVKELNSDHPQLDNDSLKKLRNQLVHGKSRLETMKEHQKLYNLLWKKLDRSAAEWDVHELANFLSYCIGGFRKSETELSNLEVKEVVKFYKSKFSAMDIQDKNRSFTELILRLYGDPVFQNRLDKNTIR